MNDSSFKQAQGQNSVEITLNGEIDLNRNLETEIARSVSRIQDILSSIGIYEPEAISDQKQIETKQKRETSLNTLERNNSRFNGVFTQLSLIESSLKLHASPAKTSETKGSAEV